MELIKKIKEAEQQAAKIVLDAEKDAKVELEQAKADREKKLAQAASERKTTIAKAIKDAQSEGYVESEKIKQHSQAECKGLDEAASKSVTKAADMIYDYVLSMAAGE